MSIAYEISRLANAVEDIKTSITGKGVTVPTGTKADGLAALVDMIEGQGPTITKKLKATTTTTLSAPSSSISFEVDGRPIDYLCVAKFDVSGSTDGNVAFISCCDFYQFSSSMKMNTSQYNTSEGGLYNESYSNNVFTLTNNVACDFAAGTYELTYAYGESCTYEWANVVDVGSGVTSISFSGLDEEPEWFCVQILTDVKTSSGYSRAIAITYDKDRSPAVYGFDETNNLRALSAWAVSYNNGTLTITSNGTNNGGYFHSPAVYLLSVFKPPTMQVSSYELQSKAVTPTTTQQTVTPDEWYYGLAEVSVGGIPAQYQDISTALPDITSALAEKGVTVPVGTGINEVAGLVRQIETGNGKNVQFYAGMDYSTETLKQLQT